jgi:hypothetical protein
MGTVDKVVFERRGGRGCSNSDYHVRQTSCCNAWCVEDSELGDLYIDGANLSAVISLLGMPSEKAPACPLCGAQDWDLRAVEDIKHAPDTWRWALSRS